MDLKKYPTNRGFTLIELLVVVSLIIIMGGILVVTINAAKRAMKRSETRAIIAQHKQQLLLSQPTQASPSRPQHIP